MTTSDPRALLERLLQEKTEVEWLEFKHNNSDPDLIGRTISACSNAAILAERDKAFIVWGIENQTRKKVGTTVRLREMKGKGNEGLHNWLTTLLEPKILLEPLDFSTEDGMQFSIMVMEPTYDRPVRFAGMEYVRVGEHIKALKDLPEHTRSLWLATSRRKFENAIALTHQSLPEIFEKLDTHIYYKLSDTPRPENDLEIVRKLVSIGAIKEDMEGGYDVTNLGALLFAKDITAFPPISTKSVRVIKYSGTDKRQSEGEIEGRRGYAVGFEGMLKYILDRLPKKEIYDRGVRKNVPQHSEIAVREILANALIHQDFTVTGSAPVVEIYQDRLEISNPGKSLIAIDRIIDERRSRNEKFAETMREMGLCEERGGGIDKAILDIEEKFLPAPLFIHSATSMRVVIFGPKTFAELSKTDRVWACYCHCVVRWIRHNLMNNASLRQRFSLPDEDYQIASEVIANAKKEKKIKPAESGQSNKYARYIPHFVTSS
jgi:predicted HTH transcriptional regulator